MKDLSAKQASNLFVENIHNQNYQMVEFMHEYVQKFKFMSQFHGTEISNSFYFRLTKHHVQPYHQFLDLNQKNSKLYMIDQGKCWIIKGAQTQKKMMFDNFVRQFQEQELTPNISFKKVKFGKCNKYSYIKSTIIENLIKKRYTYLEISLYFLQIKYPEATIDVIGEGDTIEENCLIDLREKSEEVIFTIDNCLFFGIDQQTFRRYLIQPLKENQKRIYKILKHCPYFKHLKIDQQRILSEFSQFTLIKQNYLAMENEKLEHLYIIQKGQVQVMQRNKLISTIEENQCFGEESLSNQPLQYDFFCPKETELIQISLKKFIKSKRIPIIKRSNLKEKVTANQIQRSFFREEMQVSQSQKQLNITQKLQKLLIPKPIPSNINPYIFEKNKNIEDLEDKLTGQKYFFEKKLKLQQNQNINIRSFNGQSNSQILKEMMKNKLKKFNFLWRKDKNIQIKKDLFVQSVSDEESSFITKKSKSVKLLKSQNKPVTYLEKIRDYYQSYKIQLES